MTSLFQPHVLPAAQTDLGESQLFQDEDKLDAKEKDLIHQITQKDAKSISTKELTKLKNIARKHVTSSTRHSLWLILSGGLEVKDKTPGLYQDTYEELFSEGSDFIPDGYDEDGEYLTYYLTVDGGQSLRRMMCIIKHLNPDITFCPLMEPIVSILLHFMTTEDSFAVISGLLANKTNRFLAQTKADNIIDDATIQDFLKSVNSKAYERIKSFAPAEENKSNKLILFPNWRRMMFEQLDFECLVRLLDCLMVEGAKIIFRMGLYLLIAFYEYSLAFRKLDCSSPHELLATIGQHAHSLTLKPDVLMKDVFKINISTKQMEKFTEQNRKMYKSNQLEFSEDYTVNIIVAVDLHDVSDIIKPKQWQQVCQWLPPRVQIQQPYLLFSTEKDGYNLKTLYLLCENEEQTLIIIQTSNKEIFGAYLSRSLLERHDGRQNLTFFGTGETFIFRLQPDEICYHWNEAPKHKESRHSHTRKISKYVFVDTNPLQSIPENDAVDTTPANVKLKRKRRSFKRALSLNVRGAKSNPSSPSRAPLKLINIRRNASSVPRHLYLGAKQKLPGLSSSSPQAKADKKPLLQTAQTFDVAYRSDLRKMHNISNTIDEADEDTPAVKERSKSESASSSKPSLTKSKAVVDENFTVIEEESGGGEAQSGKAQVKFDIGSGDEDMTAERMELFISCDDNKFVIGGGGGGESICIDGELSNGHSTKSTTFFNEPLSKERDFTVTRVDVFGFQ